MDIVEWTEERIYAFEKLKALFSQQLVLRHIDWDKDIYLTTDASAHGVGAWIGQKNDKGDIIPVVCASKKLSPSQKRWSTTKRELFGLMWGMKKFRHYLLGRHFFANVDHKPLVSMLKNKFNVMMEGWVDNIFQFDFTTVYHSGASNNLADALSRMYTCQPRVFGLQSDKLSTLEKTLSGKIDPGPSKRKQLILQAHALGHFGVQQCVKRIVAQGYWWSDIRADVEKEIDSCTACQRFNIAQVGYNPLISIMADEPWDHVEVDLVGPLPKADDGYEYILTYTDVLTNYTVLRALRSKAMPVVAQIIWAIFCEYGNPKILQTDHGTEFKNQLLGQLVVTSG